MPRKKILSMESKRDKFLRLATLRTREALSRLRILGNCANRQLYNYEESDVKKIFSVIDKQWEDAKAKFKIIRDKKEKDFKL